MRRTCLNCRYEPVWGDWIGHEFRRRIGKCRWDKPIPILPVTHRLDIASIVRYSDDSGVMTNCPAWKEKKEG